MKKVMVGVAVALALVTSNAAADGVDRRYPPTIAAPVPYAAPPSWTGFYIGAGIGAGAVVNDVTFRDRNTGERIFDFSGGDDGVLGTAIIGWDWQLGPNSVFGVFADYDFLDRSSRHSLFDDVAGDFHHSHDHNNAWSVGARLGWLSSPSVLWYVTGGYTQVDVDHSMSGIDLDGLTISRDRTLDGYFVGAGVDTRLAASNWFLRLEYRFSDFDTARLRIRDDAGDVNLSFDNDTQAHTARLTLTYKFTGGYGGWGR